MRLSTACTLKPSEELLDHPNVQAPTPEVLISTNLDAHIFYLHGLNM